MGALEDIGYVVNRDEEDAFGLGNLGSCGSACPAANRRQMLRSSLNNSTATSPQLSANAKQSLLEAAANRFRNRRATVTDARSEDDFIEGNAVSYIYEENGHYLSRVIHRHQVEHLI